MQLYMTDKTLNQVSKEIEHGKDMYSVAADMFELMLAQGGVGLAANQVGLEERLFVFNVPGGESGTILNPRITRRTCGKVRSTEGCLSLPGVRAVVERDKQITVEGFTLDWQPYKRKLRGLQAIVFQHEIDHLDGKTLLDTGRVLS